METWNKRKEYNEKIRPLVKQIYQICEAEAIPFFCVAAPAQDEGSVECYSSQVIVSEKVLPDRFKLCISIMQDTEFAELMMNILNLYFLEKSFKTAKVTEIPAGTQIQ
jgi:hypothetical protein